METAWFAVQVHPRFEFRARAELSNRGFESFLPVRTVNRRWSDRIKSVELPLFPGYLFSRFPDQERGRVLGSPGVKAILGCGRTPTPVSADEIDTIRVLVTSGRLLVPWPYLRAGQRVRIEHGPLSGVAGFVARADPGSTRIVVSVDLLQRSVAAEIDREWLAPCR